MVKDTVGNELRLGRDDLLSIGLNTSFEVVDNSGVVFDTDGDGVSDGDDAFPSDPSEWIDTDEDGVGNNADTDDDGDGVEDDLDDYPTDPTNFTDTDGDGVYDFFDAAPNDPSNAKR